MKKSNGLNQVQLDDLIDSSLDIDRYNIFFLSNPEKAVINNDKIPEDTYLIYHESYTPPELQNVENIPFNEYKTRYMDLHTNMIILVGLNRMITPSNRTEFVHEYLSILTPHIPKVSIDTSPFIGEPWRLFFHYLFTNNNQFGMAHSYAMQTEWNHWFYRDNRDCLLSADNVGFFIIKTFTDLDPLFTEFKFTDVSHSDEEWYSEAKRHTFDKFNTPKSLVNYLLKLCNEHFKIDLSYTDYLSGQSSVIPDLGVYRFVVEENLRRKSIYNIILQKSSRVGR